MVLELKFFLETLFICVAMYKYIKYIISLINNIIII
jgi:hypothetical protein